LGKSLIKSDFLRYLDSLHSALSYKRFRKTLVFVVCEEIREEKVQFAERSKVSDTTSFDFHILSLVQVSSKYTNVSMYCHEVV
jgi:hypothetical protein